MVTQDSKWDINAIPAAIEVSFPNALGMTIVFNPNGIEREHNAQTNAVFDIEKNDVMPIKMKGINK